VRVVESAGGKCDGLGPEAVDVLDVALEGDLDELRVVGVGVGGELEDEVAVEAPDPQGVRAGCVDQRAHERPRALAHGLRIGPQGWPARAPPRAGLRGRRRRRRHGSFVARSLERQLRPAVAQLVVEQLADAGRTRSLGHRRVEVTHGHGLELVSWSRRAGGKPDGATSAVAGLHAKRWTGRDARRLGCD
jgi:hypothetical protein